ncbi:MAG: hypothetical protein ABEJ08_04665 [Halobacteriaceae archaeon]
MTRSPRDSQSNRLRAVFLPLVVAVLLATAGCGGALQGGDTSNAPETGISDVPSGVDLVASMDVNGMLQDDAHRQIIQTYLNLQANRSTYDGPTSIAGALGDIRNDTGIAPKKINDALVYGKMETGTQYLGIIVTTAQQQDDFVSGIRDNADFEFEQGSYNGHTVYRPKSEMAASSSYIGVLGDKKYVLGTEEAVKDAIDVAKGNASTVSGPVRSAYENTRDGYIRFAASVPQDQLPAEEIGEGSQFNTGVFNDVTTVSGAHYTDGDTVGVKLTLSFSSKDSAGKATDITSGAVQLYRGVISDSPAKPMLSEENLTISQSGKALVITSENPTSRYTTVLKFLFASNLGMGPTV